MSFCRAVTLCLLIATVAALCSGLVLERLPRHIPSKNRFQQESVEDDDLPGTFDSSVEKRKIVQDPSQLAPMIMKPTWKAIYPFAQEKHVYLNHQKRGVSNRNEDAETSEKDRHELANILKDEDQDDEKEEDKKKSVQKSASRHIKTKRQSNDESNPGTPVKDLTPADDVEQEEPPPNPDFQDWLRREYYRNMAKSFASMRRKRSSHEEDNRRMSGAVSTKKEKKNKKPVSFEEVTDNLRAIEDVLFLDALQAIKDAGEDYEDDVQKQNRITNDLSSAYDLETMRNALFRLRDTLGNMESESNVEDVNMYKAAKKRSDQCPPLDLLTSDCSALADIVPDGTLKRQILHFCNWHEVCYTCGEVYGLTSESCDMGFVEQSQTICQGDVPCESTASLLLLPLRQRRIYYKRSSPSVCLVDPCVEAYLRQV